MSIIHIMLIMCLLVLTFSSCNLSKTGYEGIEFVSDSIYHDLRNNTHNVISSGYYQLEAADSAETVIFTLIFPAYDMSDIYSIPFDAYTEIRYYNAGSNELYRASSAEGSGMIIVETEPDSAFNQLTGTFEAVMVNINDDADTMHVTEGYFLFLF